MYHSLAYTLLCVLFLMAPTPVFQDRQAETAPAETPIPKLPDGTPLHGTVLTPEGLLAADATVALATGKFTPYVHRGEIMQIKGKEEYVIKTNHEGKFLFGYFNFNDERRPNLPKPPAGVETSDYSITIVHDSGCCRVTQEEMEAAIFKKTPIKLEQWGRIEGTVYTGTKPAKRELMNYDVDNHPDMGWIWNPRVYWNGDDADSDADGQFVIEKIPPGKVRVARTILIETKRGTMGYSADTQVVDVCGGETTFIRIGGEGRPVVGKLVPKNTEPEFDPKDYVVHLNYMGPAPDIKVYANLYNKTVPTAIRRERDAAQRDKMLAEWESTTEEGKAFAPERRKYEAEKAAHERRLNDQKLSGISQGGTFRIDDVPAGKWYLMVATCDNIWGGRLTHNFQIEAIPNGVSDDPLDVGTLTFTVPPPEE